MVSFGIKSVPKVVTERRNVVPEKSTTGRGASSRKFVQKMGGMTYFFVGDATQVDIGHVGRTHTIVRLQTRIRRKMGRRFWGFCICVGFPQRFCVVGIYVLDRFQSVFSATTPRNTTPHPYHHGLSRLCIHPGCHAIVYFFSLVITPELSRSTTHVHWVTTPAIVVRIL